MNEKGMNLTPLENIEGDLIFESELKKTRSWG
jgi:hypothetical protein